MVCELRTFSSFGVKGEPSKIGGGKFLFSACANFSTTIFVRSSREAIKAQTNQLSSQRGKSKVSTFANYSQFVQIGGIVFGVKFEQLRSRIQTSFPRLSP